MTGNSAACPRLCVIHGHFYQPPRENPWIGIVERQASAAPAHDWNERVYSECYRPNAYSRVLNSDGMITAIHNNYRILSFNFGPTLLRWIEDKHPDVAGRILDADRESCERLDGHGNALAQVYNHIIMPLASRRDQLTQIRWAKSFFRSRFGRDPEGLWLSETAINMQTVRCLIEEGLRFVVLSPTQADAFRPLDQDAAWETTRKKAIDTRRPYRVFACSRNGTREQGSIDVFFFDEKLSREASFGRLLNDAGTFADELAARFDAKRRHDQVVVLATDGETFGHHRPYADMCVAYFAAHTAGMHELLPVNFGYALAKMPPAHEVRLKNAFGDGTAWSCAHGTGRWRTDCGCQTGGPDSWSQKWRAPMREAFDALQRRLDASYEQSLSGLVADPWRVRDEYRAIMENPSHEALWKMLSANGAADSMPADTFMRTWKLLEAQKFMLYAYTSCGWFFADIGGLEAVQNLRYACRALQLGLQAEEYNEARAELCEILERAPGNVPGTTGRTVFEREALPYLHYREILCFAAALEHVVSESTSLESELFGHRIMLRKAAGVARRRTDAFVASIRNESTGERAAYSILLRHRYSARILGYVVPFDVEETEGFDQSNIKRWTGHPDSVALGLADIFIESKDAISRHFIRRISKSTTARYLSWMRTNERVLGALAGLNGSLPEFLRGPVAYLMTTEWDAAMSLLYKKQSEEEVFSILLDLSRRARSYGVTVDYTASVHLLESLCTREMEKLGPEFQPPVCDRIRFLLNVVDRFVIPVDKSRLEDAFYPLLQGPVKKAYDEAVEAGTGIRGGAKASLARILSFARRMNFATDQFPLD